MNMKIAVADDERPARSELIHQLHELIPKAEIEEADSGAAVLNLVVEKKFDLLFLDINLGDIQGTALVKALRNIQQDMKIIFVTAYSEYAVEAFELEVENYIMKPFSKKRLEKVLEKCRHKTEETRERGVAEPPAPKRLSISHDGKTVFEDIGNIVYIETYNRGCLIHVIGKSYYEGKTIGEYERKLEGRGFFRCQKSYLINLEKVSEIFPWRNNSLGLKLQGYENEVLPVAREKTKIIRQLLG